MSDVENVEVLNERGEVVSVMTREEAEAANHTTENIVVFLFNSLGRVWVQLRPLHKKHYPGLWDVTACGGIHAGESPEKAAVRETHEETLLGGIALHHVKTFMNIFPADDGITERRRKTHVFVGITEQLPRTNAEVDEFTSWDTNELEKNVAEWPDMYIPSFGVELQIAVDGYAKLINGT